MSVANPLWGAPRIHGELLKLGIDVGQSTVAKYMVRSDGVVLTMLFGERHLRHLLNSYQKYYNEARTHLSLHKDAPVPGTIQTVGRTLAMPVLGGLHHQYFRA
jgi:hypothetical protein